LHTSGGTYLCGFALAELISNMPSVTFVSTLTHWNVTSVTPFSSREEMDMESFDWALVFLRAELDKCETHDEAVDLANKVVRVVDDEGSMAHELYHEDEDWHEVIRTFVHECNTHFPT